MELKFKIKGLDCANCASALERKISKIKGINKVSISFMTEKMVVELDESDKTYIIKDIEKLISKEEPDVILEEI